MLFVFILPHYIHFHSLILNILSFLFPFPTHIRNALGSNLGPKASYPTIFVIFLHAFFTWGEMRWGGQLHAPAALPPRKEPPWCPLDRRLGGPQSRSERGGEEKNSQPLPGLEPPIIQPVARRYSTELSLLLLHNVSSCIMVVNKRTLEVMNKNKPNLIREYERQ
jgi:hypothetical protein